MRTVLLFVSLTILAIQSHADDELLAGFYTGDITPPVGVPLAGYGSMDRRLMPPDLGNKYPYSFYFKPSKGVLDPIHAKVLVLRKGQSKLLFIGLDYLALTQDIRRELVEKLRDFGFRDEEIIISCTHTHSGPGAISKNLLWQLIAIDQFNQEAYNYFIQHVYWSVANAMLTVEPSDLYRTEYTVTGLNKNRRTKGDNVDTQARLLLVKSRATGLFTGSLINYTIHPTMLRPQNRFFSADVTGAIERHMNQELFARNASLGAMPQSIFINGAEGDVAPAQSGATSIEPTAQSFIEQSQSGLSRLTPVDPEIEIKVSKVKLDTASFNVRGCTKDKIIRKILWKDFALWLGWAMPRTTHIWQIKIGDIQMFSWPGEPTTYYGMMLKELGASMNAGTSWILGLTNDYMGYFTTPEEYRQPEYESCSSMYGKKGGNKILNKHRALAEM